LCQPTFDVRKPLALSEMPYDILLTVGDDAPKVDTKMNPKEPEASGNRGNPIAVLAKTVFAAGGVATLFFAIFVGVALFGSCESVGRVVETLPEIAKFTHEDYQRFAFGIAGERCLPQITITATPFCHANADESCFEEAREFTISVKRNGHQLRDVELDLTPGVIGGIPPKEGSDYRRFFRLLPPTSFEGPTEVGPQPTGGAELGLQTCKLFASSIDQDVTFHIEYYSLDDRSPHTAHCSQESPVIATASNHTGSPSRSQIKVTVETVSDSEPARLQRISFLTGAREETKVTYPHRTCGIPTP